MPRPMGNRPSPDSPQTAPRAQGTIRQSRPSDTQTRSRYRSRFYDNQSPAKSPHSSTPPLATFTTASPKVPPPLPDGGRGVPPAGGGVRATPTPTPAIMP